jgi:hypothetical protein
MGFWRVTIPHADARPSSQKHSEVSGSPPVPARSPPPTTARDVRKDHLSRPIAARFGRPSFRVRRDQREAACPTSPAVVPTRPRPAPFIGHRASRLGYLLAGGAVAWVV